MQCTSTSLDDEEYDDVKEKLNDIITTLASTFDETVQKHCSKCIVNFTTGELDVSKPEEQQSQTIEISSEDTSNDMRGTTISDTRDKSKINDESQKSWSIHLESSSGDGLIYLLQTIKERQFSESLMDVASSLTHYQGMNVTLKASINNGDVFEELEESVSRDDKIGATTKNVDETTFMRNALPSVSDEEKIFMIDRIRLIKSVNYLRVQDFSMWYHLCRTSPFTKKDYEYVMKDISNENRMDRLLAKILTGPKELQNSFLETKCSDRRKLDMVNYVNRQTASEKDITDFSALEGSMTGKCQRPNGLKPLIKLTCSERCLLLKSTINPDGISAYLLSKIIISPQEFSEIIENVEIKTRTAVLLEKLEKCSQKHLEEFCLGLKQHDSAGIADMIMKGRQLEPISYEHEKSPFLSMDTKQNDQEADNVNRGSELELSIQNKSKSWPDLHSSIIDDADKRKDEGRSISDTEYQEHDMNTTFLSMDTTQNDQEADNVNRGSELELSTQKESKSWPDVQSSIIVDADKRKDGGRSISDTEYQENDMNTNDSDSDDKYRPYLTLQHERQPHNSSDMEKELDDDKADQNFDLSDMERELDVDKADQNFVFEEDPFFSAWNENAVKRLISQGKLPTQNTLNDKCLVLGRKSKVVRILCEEISKHIKSMHDGISHVWAAYTLKNPDRITFVICLTEKLENKDTKPLRLEKMIEYSFVKRYFGDFNPEGTEIMKQRESSIGLNEEAHHSLMQCISKISGDLMTKHKYLSIITASSHRSKGFDSSWKLVSEHCIVLYVHTKNYIPIAEDPFEANYDDINVDVREGAFIPFGATAKDVLDNVRMGCQIMGDQDSSGSLGCFIDHPQYGCCGLTCAHVLLTPWEMIHLKTVHNGTLEWPLHNMYKNVYQPDNQRSPIGHTVQFVYKEGSNENCGMDLALFKITDRQPISPRFPDASTGSNAALGINYDNWRMWGPERLNTKDCHVVKFGATTEYRTGIIAFENISVKELDFHPLREGYGTLKLFKQIEVKSDTPGLEFATFGDSGSLVFLVEENNKHACLGIVEGGTPYGTVVVTPIVPILNEIKVSCLKSFETETNFSNIHNQLQTMHGEIQNVNGQLQAGNQVVQTVSSDLQFIKQLLLNPPR